jgi:hypothetical protein
LYQNETSFFSTTATQNITTQTTMPNNNITKDYSVAQVASWISSLGMPSHTFVENDVDGDLLFSLSTLDLQNLGLLTSSQANLLQNELGQTKCSSYKEQTERTLEYLQQENDDLAHDNEALEKRNVALETELKRLRMLVYYMAANDTVSTTTAQKATTNSGTRPVLSVMKQHYF